MTSKWIALVAGLALAVGCASLPGGLEAPEVSLVGLEPLPSESLEQRFDVRLRVMNPNDRTLSIDGVDFTLEVNGSRLTRGLTNEEVTIPRLSEAVVSVTATTTVLDLVRQVLSAADAETVSYELHGRVFLADSPGWLSFSRTGSFDGILSTR